LVVRFSNKDITTQIVAADLTHDVVLAAAYAHELPRFGIKLGLTNYAAAYATGLLLARRVNTKFGLKYEGATAADGAEYHVEPEDDGPQPFKALLDVGLARTTTGAKIFGALKGVSDGGVNVPHSVNRFPGAKVENNEVVNSDETTRKYILGGHVAEYMRTLQDEDEERYGKQFKRFVDAGLNADNLEAVYTKAHAAIRADPFKKRDAKELGRFKTRTTPKTGKETYAKKKFHKSKLSIEQKQARIRQKLTARGIKKIDA